VVEHCSLLQVTRASTAFSPLGTAWVASGGMFMPSARTSSISMELRYARCRVSGGLEKWQQVKEARIEFDAR
jgi:hypothetical protein